MSGALATPGGSAWSTSTSAASAARPRTARAGISGSSPLVRLSDLVDRARMLGVEAARDGQVIGVQLGGHVFDDRRQPGQDAVWHGQPLVNLTRCRRV